MPEVKRVLVVDDDEGSRDAFVRAIRKLDVEVDQAGNGQTALELGGRQSYAVVATDVSMPGIDGFELIDKFRALQPDAIFILITGIADLDHTRGKARSVAAVVFKPWDAREVKGAVEQALRLWCANQLPEFAKDLVRGKNFLLVTGDENDAQRVILQLNQSSVGHAVAWARTVGETQKLLAGKSFDVAIVDLFLSDASGLDTMRRLRHLAPRLPLVLLAGDEEPHAILTALEEGAHDYLLKGTHNRRDVVRAIHQAIDRKRVEDGFKERLKEFEEAKRLLGVDLAERKRQVERLEVELRLAHKLEAVGQLAAGIAHEINTPIQYIGDSIGFVQTSFEDLLELTATHQESLVTLGLEDNEALATKVGEAVDLADLEYSKERVGPAFGRIKEGLRQVASIVSALKQLSHPDKAKKEHHDVNKSIETALLVARNEYKYVANVEKDLGSIPLVNCHFGEISQVFLNLIVNAGHAISDAVGSSGEMGTITISSRHDAECVVVTISDTGGGIPESIKERVFDPFFTTKEVGKGTGQGLALARNIVVDHHGGWLSFESKVGKGTTFVIRLPIEQAEASPAQRIHRRISLSVPLEITTGIIDAPIPSVLINISQGGALVETTASVEAGSDIGLCFRAPDGSSCKADGRVVRVSHLGKHYGLGVRFARINEETEAFVTSLVTSVAEPGAALGHDAGVGDAQTTHKG